MEHRSFSKEQRRGGGIIFVLLRLGLFKGFLQTALLGHNPHATQLTVLTVRSMVFSTCTTVCDRHHSQCQKTRTTLKGGPYRPFSTDSLIPLPSSPKQPLLRFLSQRIYLFWTSIYYVVFCNWPLSLSTMFSRGILVVAQVRTSFLPMGE